MKLTLRILQILIIPLIILSLVYNVNWLLWVTISALTTLWILLSLTNFTESFMVRLIKWFINSVYELFNKNN